LFSIGIQVKQLQLIFILLLAGTFGFLANDLYERQNDNSSYLSFKLNDSSTDLVVPDFDRFINKLKNNPSFHIQQLNPTLESGIESLRSNLQNRMNWILGETCFISYNETSFVIAFENPDLNFDDIINVLKVELGVQASFSEEKIEINGKSFYTMKHGVYTVFSDQAISFVKDKTSQQMTDYQIGNADYVILKDSLNTEKHIFANQSDFKVNTTFSYKIKGKPVNHFAFITNLPTTFDEIFFYGSQRFQEDKNMFFDSTGSVLFEWVDDGIAIVKKDSFELMIGRQNEVRDLKLILEEQTLKVKGDSGQINYINLKNFEIMPFQGEENWQAAVNGISEELKFYTEYENFNVLSNSIGAMRWYLSEIQLGNLIADDKKFKKQYQFSAPQTSHQIKIKRNIANKNYISFETNTWRNRTNKTNTYTSFNLNQNNNNQRANQGDFLVSFAPESIDLYQDKGTDLILLSSENNVGLYTSSGEIKWELDLPSNLVKKPKLVDLENDGIHEITLFLENHFLIVKNDGNFHVNKKLSVPAQGGTCLNYDQKYNYRFFLIQGGTVACVDEKGELVTGWSFQGSVAQLKDEINYVQASGKDYITFKDVNNKQYVVNRRGEFRFVKTPDLDLPNESQFIVGKDEGTLRKLGYKNQYIYNAYLRDGNKDSVKLDQRVNSVSARWENISGTPLLIIEEPNRIITFNVFGYVENEILKPEGANELLGIHAFNDFNYVFFNNTQNSVYLLNKEGKTIHTITKDASKVYGINSANFCSFDGKSIKNYTLNF